MFSFLAVDKIPGAQCDGGNCDADCRIHQCNSQTGEACVLSLSPECGYIASNNYYLSIASPDTPTGANEGFMVMVNYYEDQPEEFKITSTGSFDFNCTASIPCYLTINLDDAKAYNINHTRIASFFR